MFINTSVFRPVPFPEFDLHFGSFSLIDPCSKFPFLLIVSDFPTMYS